MAKISSPIGPTIDVVATTVSRSVIAGGGGGRGMVPTGGGGAGGGGGTGRGGAIVVRPQTSLVDRAQDLRIQKSEQTISTLGPSLNIIEAQIRVLNDNNNRLLAAAQEENAVEQAQLRREQERERRLTERRIRAGRESELEQNITAALARPIVNLQKKITSLFDRIMGALTTLFFGWLTNQGIETLKALASGDKEKLENIKNNVIKNILYAVGAFAAVNLGFGLLMRTITGLTFRLAGLTARIALAPFQAIARVLGFGGRGAQAAARTAQAARAGRVAVTGSTNLMTRMFNFIRGAGGRGAAGAAEGVAAKTGSRLIPGLQQALGLTAAAVDFSQGDVPAGLLSLLSAAPGPIGWIGLGGRTLYGASKGEFDGLMGKPSPTSTKTPPAKQSPTPAPSTPTKAAVTPQESMVPSAPQLSFNPEQINQQMTTESAVDSMLPFTMSFDGTEQEQTTITSANIQSPPKPQTPVGTLPEPQPNIIMAGGGTDRTQMAVSSAGTTNGRTFYSFSKS